MSDGRCGELRVGGLEQGFLAMAFVMGYRMHKTTKKRLSRGIPGKENGKSLTELTKHCTSALHSLAPSLPPLLQIVCSPSPTCPQDSWLTVEMLHN